jgi:hypothetical protein
MNLNRLSTIQEQPKEDDEANLQKISTKNEGNDKSK